MLADLNVCSQKGWSNGSTAPSAPARCCFPSAAEYQATPGEAWSAKLPVMKGETTTGTAMSWGYFPQPRAWSPFHGAVFAVVEAVARIVATGGEPSYGPPDLAGIFRKTRQRSRSAGASRLPRCSARSTPSGARISRQSAARTACPAPLKIISVPPTLVAFALTPIDVRTVISPEFKAARPQRRLPAAPRATQRKCPISWP